jgi:hypothetical protein
MKNEKYFVFCLFCIAYYFLAAFAWDHFLSILITSFFWVSSWYLSNRKFIAQAKAKDVIIEKKQMLLDAGEKIRKELFVEYTGLHERYKKNLEIIKVIRKSMVARLGDNEPVINAGGLKVPQSEAAMKLDSKIHNSITLDAKNYEQE